MLPRADLSIAAVGRVEAPAAVEGAVDARQQAFQRSLATMLGKSLQAEILSKFNDGSFLVKVAGATARMQLPPSAQVGAQVALTLVALEPRPTFEIGSQPGSRAVAEAGPEPDAAPLHAAPDPAAAGARPVRLPVAMPDATALPAPAGPGAASVGSSAHAAALLGKAPLIPAAQLPALDNSTAPATLSAAGKILGSVLGAAQQAGAAPATLVGRTPLLAGPPLAPQQLAAALQQAVANSGLFYESHLAEWAGGTRSTAELAQEPQMQRAPAPDATTRAPQPADPASTASAQLVNLQLQTHEQARVAWLGQAWPGQAMQWDIERDAPERGGSDNDAADAEPGWRSSVRLRFPLLGELGARISLSGQRLQIHIDASDAAVGQVLRAHAAALGQSLEAAGTPLAGLTIRTAPQDAEP